MYGLLSYENEGSEILAFFSKSLISIKKKIVTLHEIAYFRKRAGVLPLEH